MSFAHPRPHSAARSIQHRLERGKYFPQQVPGSMQHACPHGIRLERMAEETQSGSSVESAPVRTRHAATFASELPRNRWPITRGAAAPGLCCSLQKGTRRRIRAKTMPSSAIQRFGSLSAVHRHTASQGEGKPLLRRRMWMGMETKSGICSVLR